MRPAKNESKARQYVRKMLASNSITQEIMQEADLAFRYAEQFQSPQKEIELVQFIFARQNEKMSKAA